MGQSNRLTFSDVRAVFRLLGEVRELREKPVEMHKLLLDGLCELTGARNGFYVHFENFTASGTIGISQLTTGGAADAKALAFLAQWGAKGKYREDPLVDQTSRRGGERVTACRRDLVEDDVWFASAFFEEVCDPTRTADGIVSFFRRNKAGAASGFALHRETGAGEFTIRERRRVALFTHELLQRYRTHEFDVSGISPSINIHLSPRQRAVLSQLLAGEHPKGIATNLAISVYTVRDYIKAIYEKFGVSGRAELMAKLLRAPPSQ